MVSISIDRQSVASMQKMFSELGSSITKELRVAITKTAKQVKIQASRKLRLEIKAPAKVLKRVVIVAKQATVESLSAEIVLIKGYQIPLKYFSPRQTQRGVTVTVSPRFGKISVAGSFMTKTKRYKGNVFTRKGRKRGPLNRELGPAPSDMYARAGITALAVKVANEQLQKQVNERIRFLTLKANGKLRGNQK